LRRQLSAAREAAPAPTAAAVGGSRAAAGSAGVAGCARAPCRPTPRPGRGAPPEAPSATPTAHGRPGLPAGPRGGGDCTQPDARGLVEHTQAPRECPRRNSATSPRTLGRRGARQARQRASGDCLLKTQDPANWAGCTGSDTCPVPGGDPRPAGPAKPR